MARIVPQGCIAPYNYDATQRASTCCVAAVKAGY